MLNAPQPKPEDLPTPSQLRRSTTIAVVVAAAIGVAVVLPAEYAIDPTGLGGPTGLQEMGEIKQQLQREADEDDHHSGLADDGFSLAGAIGSLFVGQANAQTADDWKDQASFTLEPGEGYEIKLAMSAGAVAEYEWTADGGRMNYDLHAHAGDQDARYKRGRGETGDAGSFTAEFDGDHGWFFRNRDRQAVTVTLRVRGDYSEVKHDLYPSAKSVRHSRADIVRISEAIFWVQSPILL